MRNGGTYIRAIPAMLAPALLYLAVFCLPGLVRPDEAGAERVRRAGMIIAFDGGIAPKALPRRGSRPITARLSGRVRAVDGGPLPQLRRLEIDINRNAIIARRGLPICRLDQVSDALASVALENCRRSLVGRGRFGVLMAFPDQLPTYTQGRVFAFHSRIGGRPAILMHVVTISPVAVAITVPMTISRLSRGSFGARLSSPSLPQLIGHHIYTTDFSFTLGRTFRLGGRQRSYLRAGCPAPPGFAGGFFSLARATFEFRSGRKVRQTLTRNCRAVNG